MGRLFLQLTRVLIRTLPHQQPHQNLKIKKLNQQLRRRTWRGRSLFLAGARYENRFSDASGRSERDARRASDSDRSAGGKKEKQFAPRWKSLQSFAIGRRPTNHLRRLARSAKIQKAVLGNNGKEPKCYFGAAASRVRHWIILRWMAHWIFVFSEGGNATCKNLYFYLFIYMIYSKQKVKAFVHNIK
jgi:hypothetical protein